MKVNSKKSAAQGSKEKGKKTSPRKKINKQGAKKTLASTEDKKRDENSGRAKPENNSCEFS